MLDPCLPTLSFPWFQASQSVISLDSPSSHLLPQRPLLDFCKNSFLSFRFQSPPHNQREELPLGAMAGITSDILGLDVLLWLMAGSSKWS